MVLKLAQRKNSLLVLVRQKYFVKTIFTFFTIFDFTKFPAKEGMRYNFRGVVADPEECEMEDLTELKNLEDDLEGPVLAVFCVATYGEGDPTDNAQAFFDWLQEGTASVNGKYFKIS